MARPPVLLPRAVALGMDRVRRVHHDITTRRGEAMTHVEFVHQGNRYRIAVDDDELTMSHHSDTGWNEIGRLTVTAAGVLADLDGVIPNRAPLSVADAATAGDHVDVRSTPSSSWAR